MWHFFKYFFGTLVVFCVLNFFRSNAETAVPLKFQIPLIGEWATPGIPVFYLLIVAFCGGILLAGLMGAFRFEKVRAEKRDLEEIKKVPADPGNLPPIL